MCTFHAHAHFPLAVTSICKLSFFIAPVHLSQSDFDTPVKKPSCCCQVFKLFLSWLFFSCHFSAVNHIRLSASCVHQSSAEILLSLAPSSFSVEDTSGKTVICHQSHSQIIKNNINTNSQYVVLLLYQQLRMNLLTLVIL